MRLVRSLFRLVKTICQYILGIPHWVLTLGGRKLWWDLWGVKKSTFPKYIYSYRIYPLIWETPKAMAKDFEKIVGKNRCNVVVNVDKNLHIMDHGCCHQ